MQILLTGLANLLVVLIVVQVVKLFVFPALRGSLLLPLMTLVLGVGIAVFQTFVALWSGLPIGLPPVVGIFTGMASVAVNQIIKIWTQHDAPESLLKKLLA
jgi:hypothetical protein